MLDAYDIHGVKCVRFVRRHALPVWGAVGNGKFEDSSSRVGVSSVWARHAESSAMIVRWTVLWRGLLGRGIIRAVR